MDEDTRLRLEYDNGSELLRGLTETRFRLLALVPTLAGAVVALVNGHESAVELLAIGLLGLCATRDHAHCQLGTQCPIAMAKSVGNHRLARRYR